jgi:hypothetical protein
MHDVSFHKEALRITIHNLYPGLELMSPIYCSTGTTCHVSSSQQTLLGTKVKAIFGIDSQKRPFKGILLYKIQRKHATRTVKQLHSSTKSIEDTETNIYLLMGWRFKNYGPELYEGLIECTDDFTWDEGKLWALCYQFNDRFYKSYDCRSITWFMDDGSVMKTRHNVTFGSDYKLDIVISEEVGTFGRKKSVKIDSKRLVLSL